jgi:3-hydroxybutyryl-CoA dehydrogenase
MDNLTPRLSMGIERIAVLGAGQMGNGIAQVAACAGYEVVMIDIKQDYLDNGLAAIENSLSRVVKKERMIQQDADKAISLISTSTEKTSAADADLVVEAIPEIPELKFSTFGELDLICKPEAILASNTSSISINAIADATNRPDRVIGMHFMNPVPVMKLVEIINGQETSSEVTELVVEASERMGKVPLACNDSPGFISNRILCPMINEAILALEEGVAEPEAIDGIMKLGMNHPIGPLALADLIGLDTILHIMNVLHEGFEGNPKYAPSDLLKNMVSEGKLGRKSGEGFYNYS